MVDHPQLLHTVLDTTDVRALAEFYRELLGLRYRPGDEPPADRTADEPDWLPPPPLGRTVRRTSRTGSPSPTRTAPASWPFNGWSDSSGPPGRGRTYRCSCTST